MSGLERTWEEAQQLAENQDCEVVKPGPNQLLLDFDSRKDVARFLNRINPRLDEHYTVERIEWWISKSGGNRRHCRITLGSDLPEMERLALEALCGSDPIRTLLGIQRSKQGVDGPSVLFKPKGAEILSHPYPVEEVTPGPFDDFPWPF